MVGKPGKNAPIKGELYQLGVVVRDINEAMERYGALFGLGPWWRLDTDYNARYRGWHGRIANRNAFARWNDVWLEMVEPGIGEGNAREWLEQRGEGIFHLGFSVKDVTDIPEKWPVVFESLDARTPEGHTAVVHLDTVADLGYFTELSDYRMVEMLNDTIARAVADPGAEGHVAKSALL